MSDKSVFIKALAEYLVKDQATMSIKLEMGKADALQWAKLRETTPLMGWPTVDQAETQLAAWLNC